MALLMDLLALEARNALSIYNMLAQLAARTELRHAYLLDGSVTLEGTLFLEAPMAHRDKFFET